MAGKIVYQPAPRHRCRRPQCYVAEGKWWFNGQIIVHGTVWQCDDCSKTWKWYVSVLTRNWPAGQEPRVFRPAWLPETEEEKRKRIGAQME